MNEEGLELKLARMQQRLKQVELARIIEISPSTLSAIENGWKKPTRIQADKLNYALGRQIFKDEQD